MPRPIPRLLIDNKPNPEAMLLGSWVLSCIGGDRREQAQRACSSYGLNLDLWDVQPDKFPVDFSAGRVGDTAVVWIFGTQNLEQWRFYTTTIRPVFDDRAGSWIQRWAWVQLDRERLIVGRSESDFIGIRRVVFFGHSLGAAIAWEAARQLKLRMPADVRIETMGFGRPRSSGESLAPERPDVDVRITTWSSSEYEQDFGFTKKAIYAPDPVARIPPYVISALADDGGDKRVSPMATDKGRQFHYDVAGRALPIEANRQNSFWEPDVLDILGNLFQHRGGNHMIDTSYLPMSLARYQQSKADGLDGIVSLALRQVGRPERSGVKTEPANQRRPLVPIDRNIIDLRHWLPEGRAAMRDWLEGRVTWARKHTGFVEQDGLRGHYPSLAADWLQELLDRMDTSTPIEFLSRLSREQERIDGQLFRGNERIAIMVEARAASDSLRSIYSSAIIRYRARAEETPEGEHFGGLGGSWEPTPEVALPIVPTPSNALPGQVAPRATVQGTTITVIDVPAPTPPRSDVLPPRSRRPR